MVVDCYIKVDSGSNKVDTFSFFDSSSASFFRVLFLHANLCRFLVVFCLGVGGDCAYFDDVNRVNC